MIDADSNSFEGLKLLRMAASQPVAIRSLSTRRPTLARAARIGSWTPALASSTSLWAQCTRDDHPAKPGIAGQASHGKPPGQAAARCVIACFARRHPGAGRQLDDRRQQRWWTSTRVC